MFLSHLSLLNYRSYQRLELELSPGRSLFAGDNAQGKTNLLEAAYLLSTLKSPRTDSDAELVSWATGGGEAPACKVAGRVERRAGPLGVEVQLIGRGPAPAAGDVPQPIPYASRRVRVNGAPRRSIDAVGLLNAVLFSTQDIDLVTGSPSQRRRYMDLTLAQMDPLYRRHLSEYSKVTTQRNALLRRIQERASREDELEFWDARLVEHGAQIVAGRARLVAEVSEHARREHEDLSGGRERLDIVYEPRIPGAGPDGVGEPAAAAGALQAALPPMRAREIGAGMTLVGPHRDDVGMTIGGTSAAAFGSRAQLRTAALALRLAEASVLRATTGETPVLLLDDILSEMDTGRRATVLARLSGGGQVLITTAEPEVFPPSFLQGTAQYRVRLGEVESI